MAVLLLLSALVPAARLGRTGLMVSAVLAVVTLLAGAARVARRLVGGGTGLDRAVVAGVIAWAVVVVVGTGLGHGGWLWRRPFWALVAGLALAASWLKEHRVVETSPASTDAGGGSRFELRASLGARATAALVAAAVALLVAGVVSDLRSAQLEPPGARAFDDLSYHLPAAATWWRAGDLRMLKFTMGDPATAFYPIDGELVSWALLALLDGNDFLARFTELPFALALLLAVAALARRLGLDWPATGLAVALAGTVPRLVPQLMLSAGNDVASAFAALALVHAALLLRERLDRGRALAAGLALGLLVGTKYAGLLLLPVVGLPLLLALAAQRRAGGRPLAVALVLLLGAAALTGGYVYARNLVTAGNPLFPANVTLFGTTLLGGWPHVTAEAWRARPEYPIDPSRFLLDNAAQLGPLFAWLLLPGALLAPVGALLWRGQAFATRLLDTAVLALPLGAWALFLTVFFDHRDVRYLLAGVATTALATAWLAARLRGVAGVVAQGGIAIAAGLALASLLTPPHTLLVALGGLVLGSTWPEWRAPAGRLGALAARFVLPAVALLGILGADPMAHRARDYERYRLDNERAAATVDALTRGRAITLAYVGWNQPYLFLGNGLRHQVRMPPTHREPGAELYVWGGSLVMPHDAFDRAAWIANLEAAEVELVVVVRGTDDQPERGWIDELSTRFALLWNDGRTEIWRFANPPRR